MFPYICVHNNANIKSGYDAFSNEDKRIFMLALQRIEKQNGKWKYQIQEAMQAIIDEEQQPKRVFANLEDEMEF